MTESRRSSVVDPSAVADYKRVLQDVLYARPSGTRRRLAEALGNKASFISQIANPAYSVPIPARYVEPIFEVCHFSAPERTRFLEAYLRAHPGHAATAKRTTRWRAASIRVPDLRGAEKNRRLDEMLAEIALRVARLLAEER